MHSLCLVRTGDTAAGVAHARDTVSRLPQSHRIHTILDLGRKVVEAVPTEKRAGMRRWRCGRWLGDPARAQLRNGS